MSKLVHRHGYWLFGDEETVAREHMDDEPLASCLIKLFKGQSVIDFGCGTGYYVRRCLSEGIQARGFDGNPNTPQLSGGVCQVLDLSRPVDVGPADWVLSLEVGEHIRRAWEGVFLDNISRHALKGAVVSWADPAHEKGLGLGHVNCQENEYIKAEILKRGFENDLMVERQLRAASYHSHFKWTLMVFRRLGAS